MKAGSWEKVVLGENDTPGLNSKIRYSDCWRLQVQSDITE